MDSFLEYAFSFPIIAFTIPLLIMIVFWIFALLGTIDIEILDFQTEAETESSDGSSSSFLESLGLDGVPLTVAITLVEIYGFIFVFLARKYITPLFDGIISATAAGLLIAAVSLIVAIPFAAYTSRPLKRIFKTHEGVRKSDLIGITCVVTTQTVTDTFGQARAEDGMVYSVRTSPRLSITGGSIVVLIDFNKENDTYLVVTQDELMSEPAS